MPSVADQLRQAREAQNLSVPQVAESTNIKSDHLRALEEGNFNAFAAPVYIRGFVRTYATRLKLSVPQVLADLDAELSQTQKFREPPGLIAHPRGPLDFVMFQLSKLDWRKVLTVTAVVAVMVAGFWMYHHWQPPQGKDPLATLGPGLYRPPANSSSEVLPVPAKPPRR